MLVVDDEVMVRELLEMVISDRHDVRTAEDAVAATRILQSEPIDVIVADQRMPGASGIELLAWSRRELPDTVRILLTGFAEMEAVIQGINRARIWYFLHKPWNNERLLEVVDRAVRLRRRTGREHSALHRGLVALVHTHEEAHPFTARHSERVARFAGALCEQLELPSIARAQIVRAAELHDVGRLGVVASYLDHRGPLDDDMWARVREHAPLGARLLEDAGYEPPVVEIVGAHHEAVDGSGYPEGLAGDTIPFGARVVALADAFAALTAPRAHRPQRGVDEALAELRDGASARHDPALVTVFAEVCRAGRVEMD